MLGVVSVCSNCPVIYSFHSDLHRDAAEYLRSNRGQMGHICEVSQGFPGVAVTTAHRGCASQGTLHHNREGAARAAGWRGRLERL
jgi:hypothetical protein